MYTSNTHDAGRFPRRCLSPQPNIYTYTPII